MKIFSIVLVIKLLAGVSYLNAQIVPDAAAFPVPRIFINQTPSDAQYWAAARCDIATPQKGVPNNGVIEIDFIEVIQENLNTGNKKVIAHEYYNNSGQPINTNQGGLYIRNPWYVENDKPLLLSNSIQQNGILIIRAGVKSDFISHIWTPCNPVESNTRLYVRARFRISGEIGFQIGLDYSPTSDCSIHNHSEAFVSKWYGNTNGIFEEITIPDYKMKKSYTRSHYGVNTDGKYFLSGEMVNDFGASSVYLKAIVTDWKPVRMKLEQGFYVFYSNRPHLQKTIYCFMLDRNDNAHIPALLLEKGNDQLVEMIDAIGNDTAGYNFSTLPVKAISSRHETGKLSLELSFTTDGAYMYVSSPFAIKRLYITNSNGKIITDYHNDIPERIVIAGFNTGTYYLFIETEAGQFSEKFIK